MIDPRIELEYPRCTALDDPERLCDHDGWRHAESFDEIVRSLETGHDAFDLDGEILTDVHFHKDWQWQVTYRFLSQERSYLTMDFERFLVQDLPLYYTQDEFDETMENIRRNYRRTHEAHGGQEGAHCA